MITNERQYKISKAQLAKLQAAAAEIESRNEEEPLLSPRLAKAEVDALLSECEVLRGQIEEFETLKSGAVKILRADSLAELPSLLIRARIAKGQSQRQLADALGVKEQQIQRYESECYSSASLKRLVEVADALQLKVSELGELEEVEDKVTPEGGDIADWSAFPVAAMYKRQYFGDFAGTLRAAQTAAPQLLPEFAREAGRPYSPALLRQRARASSDVDHYALLAWQWRVLWLSRQHPVDAPFSRRAITKGWLTSVAQLSRLDDGPLRAREMLAQVGISLVVEPHLPGTHLDGAAFLGDRQKPVVGLTLRHDRLDNFWFALLHELVHVANHLRRGELEQVFDDFDATADEMELEADDLAGEALIPSAEWETALARYVQTETAVRDFSEKLGIHISVVAGRIRHESNNYTILSDLLGQGCVRSLFPEARFGQ